MKINYPYGRWYKEFEEFIHYKPQDYQRNVKLLDNEEIMKIMKKKMCQNIHMMNMNLY